MYGYPLRRYVQGALLAALLTIPTVQANDAPGGVMLVLDVSGSMWGRLEGREKILIAREVVGEMLDDWNPASELGVIAYGHRRKGDCADIETVVPLGVPDAEAVRGVVNALQPMGKTPLTAAVEQAAQALRYTEERATVVLVSDGRETCERDPCEAGRALAAGGVDFTAHVIGFDIAADERAGLECLAQTTGGRYFEARAASELQQALSEAVAVAQAPAPEPEPEPEPAPAAASLEAPESAPAGSPIKLSWSGPDGEGDYLTVVTPDTPDDRHGNYTYTREGSPLTLRLPDSTGIHELRYIEAASDAVLARLPIELTPVSASLTVPETAPLGSSIGVIWEGPDYEGDYLTVVSPDTPDDRHGNYTYTREGSPLNLQMPDEPGLYEVRYVLTQSRTVLARVPVEIQAVAVNLSAPAAAPAGSDIPVSWEGPDNEGDYLTVVTPDTPDDRHGNYTYTREGSPLELRLPDQAGIHEVRYVSAQSRRVLARIPLEITPVSATLSALDMVAAAEPASIRWEGPDNEGDYLTVVTPDTADDRHGDYTYTREGSPLDLAMPEEPGLYEIRYVLGQSRTVLARRPVEVVPAEQLAAQRADAGNATVSLSAVGAASGQALEGNWMVYSLDGGDVQRASGASARFELAPGNYRASLSLEGVSESLDIQVNAGDSLEQQIQVPGR